jgi:hypothetical protein
MPATTRRALIARYADTDTLIDPAQFASPSIGRIIAPDAGSDHPRAHDHLRAERASTRSTQTPAVLEVTGLLRFTALSASSSTDARRVQCPARTP